MLTLWNIRRTRIELSLSILLCNFGFSNIWFHWCFLDLHAGQLRDSSGFRRDQEYSPIYLT
ncbi:hypothetical protein PUN28_003753 [Cardiocondyla obscurior]|uniref:Uncharacterized protein n=1 Tax=Cardiocondyla obscurior TaxID=286306 RepID=A0AAW2GM04_9HYME